ncbi:MAG: hypothetical protein HDT46_08915 [Ruminococcaceae bacterium]|nr:hypothetical protein [Oscillospiraceae bacterium]
MSNRDMCISVINSMEEWQLQSVLEMLQAVKGTMDKLETGALETMQLLSEPELAKKIIEGKNTPLSECVPESEVNW